MLQFSCFVFFAGEWKTPSIKCEQLIGRSSLKLFVQGEFSRYGHMLSPSKGSLCSNLFFSFHR